MRGRCADKLKRSPRGCHPKTLQLFWYCVFIISALSIYFGLGFLPNKGLQTIVNICACVMLLGCRFGYLILCVFVFVQPDLGDLSQLGSLVDVLTSVTQQPPSSHSPPLSLSTASSPSPTASHLSPLPASSSAGRKSSTPPPPGGGSGSTTSRWGPRVASTSPVPPPSGGPDAKRPRPDSSLHSLPASAYAERDSSFDTYREGPPPASHHLPPPSQFSPGGRPPPPRGGPPDMPQQQIPPFQSGPAPFGQSAPPQFDDRRRGPLGPPPPMQGDDFDDRRRGPGSRSPDDFDDRRRGPPRPPRPEDVDDRRRGPPPPAHGSNPPFPFQHGV